MQFGILGGGFGLYGWLPALTELPNMQITTLAVYRPRLYERPELRGLIPRLRFVAELDELLDNITHLVIARRPNDQTALIEHLALRKWAGCVFLEKPIAADPSAALVSTKVLAGARIRVGDGFIMNETRWTPPLTSFLEKESAASIEIDWRFMAHHYAHSSTGWKRNPREGGGALRFYAIHLVEWLARRGTWTVVECSACDPSGEDPAVTFTIRDEAKFVTVHCDSRSTESPRFEILCESADRTMRIALRDPFDDSPDTDSVGGLPHDRRVRRVRSLVEHTIANGGAPPGLFQPHLQLWKEIEELRS